MHLTEPYSLNFPRAWDSGNVLLLADEERAVCGREGYIFGRSMGVDSIRLAS